MGSLSEINSCGQYFMFYIPKRLRPGSLTRTHGALPPDHLKLSTLLSHSGALISCRTLTVTREQTSGVVAMSLRIFSGGTGYRMSKLGERKRERKTRREQVGMNVC